jgi:glycosyltransferase involved in cell wall biosynthesis
MGIANRATLLGVVDVNKLLTIADVGVIPFMSPLASILFPNSLLEMMASEVPVVAIDTGATSEVVYDGQTGVLVEPLNPSSLCYAIEKLLTNESLASRIGRNGRDLVQKKFSFRSCTKQLIALYDQILS